MKPYFSLLILPGIFLTFMLIATDSFADGTSVSDSPVSIKPDTEEICAGTSVTFTAITPVLQNPVYQWTKNGFPAGSNAPDFTYVPVNGDILQVNVTATGFSAVSDPLVLTVYPTYAAVYISTPETQVTEGTVVSYLAETYNAGSAPLMEWLVNDIRVAVNIYDFTYTPQNGDIVQARLTVGSDVPCISTNPVTSNQLVMSVCNSAPVAFDIWGSGEYCGAVGFEFGIESSEPGVIYYLYKKFGDDLFRLNGMEQTGTGGPLSFFEEAGEYLILGKNACDSMWMNGSALVLPFNTKTYISAAGNNLCNGTQVTFTATPERNDNADYEFLWMINNSQAFPGGTSFSYTPENGDQVSAIMISPCFDYEMNNTVVMMVRDCSAAPVTWTGNVDNNWDRHENWDSGVPGISSVVVIPGNIENYPTLTAPASCESIIIESGGSFIGSEFLTVKSAMVKRDLNNQQFHFLSSPMGYPEPAFGGVFTDNQNGIWARKYDEYSGDWQNLPASALLIPGTAYSMQLTQNQTAGFIGILNSAAVTTRLLYNNPGNDPDRAGWNLVGNPFPSAIDWDMVSVNAAEQSIYAWNGTQYITWNGTIGALTNGIISAQGGVFIKASEPGYIFNRDVTIPLPARVHSNRPFLKESVANTLELEVDGNGFRDVTFIRFNENATKGFDANADAHKLWGIEEAPQLFSWSGTYPLSINELPLVFNETIDLGFSCAASGAYTITANGLSGFDASVRLLLEDKKNSAITDLSINPGYIFDYQAGEIPDRFRLHIIGASAIPEQNSIFVWYQNNLLSVSNPSGITGELHLFDLAGRVVLSSPLDKGDLTVLPISLKPGVYLAGISAVNFKLTRKIIVR
ncbi:T9SS type A sorting domain-containing protein [Lentimicrobium saccharophilum]|nr:T9SS type A sorting domain-containing protein [Lentimicrobium saccharophilum]